MVFVVRTDADPRGVVEAAEQVVAQTTGLPVTNVRTMDDAVTLATSREPHDLVAFGVVAIVPVLVGLAAVAIPAARASAVSPQQVMRCE